MNILTAFVLASSICAMCLSDENETIVNWRDTFMKFFKWFSCEYTSEAFQEYVECKKIKPQRCIQNYDRCMEKTIPQASNQKEQMAEVCKNPEILEKAYDCIIVESEASELTEEEMERLTAYVDCTQVVYRNHYKE
ncbi:hypothetical protein X975_13723, partial [Stegodyphus mimosarum]